MWLFSITIIPLFFILRSQFVFNGAIAPNKSSVFIYVLGIIFGTFYSIVIMLIFSTNPYIPHNYIFLCLYNLVFYIGPPFVILFLLLLVFFKNSFTQKVLLFPDALQGFYSIYLPFTILSYHKVLTFYPLFVEPVLFLFILFMIRVSLSALVYSAKSLIHPALKVLFVFTLLLTIVFPCFIRSMWLFGSSPILILAISFIYVLFSGLGFVIAKNKVW